MTRTLHCCLRNDCTSLPGVNESGSVYGPARVKMRSMSANRASVAAMVECVAAGESERESAPLILISFRLLLFTRLPKRVLPALVFSAHTLKTSPGSIGSVHRLESYAPFRNDDTDSPFHHRGARRRPRGLADTLRLFSQISSLRSTAEFCKANYRSFLKILLMLNFLFSFVAFGGVLRSPVERDTGKNCSGSATLPAPRRVFLNASMAAARRSCSLWILFGKSVSFAAVPLRGRIHCQLGSNRSEQAISRTRGTRKRSLTTRNRRRGTPMVRRSFLKD